MGEALKKSFEAFKVKDYISALIEIESDWDALSNKNFDKLIEIHILLRELAGDYLGALDNIEKYNVPNPILKIRILSKLGYFKEAQDAIFQELSKPTITQEFKRNLMGLAGRRMDLLLNGIDLNNEDICLDCILDVYCVIEHLLSLSRPRILRIVSEYYDNTVPKNTIDELESKNELPSASFEDFSRISFIDNVRGWLSLDEAFVLYSLAREVPEEYNIVEIGGWHGRSTLCLASGSRDGLHAKVHSVDIHEGLPGIGGESYLPMMKNLSKYGFENFVTIHKGRSEAVGNKWSLGKIGLLFIDAAHDYKSVKTDFITWKPHLADGGYVVFHDANQFGPNKLIQEVLSKDFTMIPLGYMDTIFVVQYFKGSPENKDRNFWIRFLRDRYSAYSTWIGLQEYELRKRISELYRELECREDVYT